MQRDLTDMTTSETYDVFRGDGTIAYRALERTRAEQLAAENDAIAHRAPAALEFNQIADERGLKAALEWRDGPFRRAPE